MHPLISNILGICFARMGGGRGGTDYQPLLVPLYLIPFILGNSNTMKRPHIVGVPSWYLKSLTDPTRSPMFALPSNAAPSASRWNMVAFQSPLPFSMAFCAPRSLPGIPLPLFRTFPVIHKRSLIVLRIFHCGRPRRSLRRVRKRTFDKNKTNIFSLVIFVRSERISFNYKHPEKTI